MQTNLHSSTQIQKLINNHYSFLDLSCSLPPPIVHRAWNVRLLLEGTLLQDLQCSDRAKSLTGRSRSTQLSQRAVIYFGPHLDQGLLFLLLLQDRCHSTIKQSKYSTCKSNRKLDFCIFYFYECKHSCTMYTPTQ